MPRDYRINFILKTHFVLTMSKKRHELKKELWEAVEILNRIFENEFTKKKVRHVDDNQLVLTKQQSQARLNNLLITMSSALGLLTLVLIFLSCYSSGEIRHGTYFHENVIEVEAGMRTHKLFLVHHDGKAQKLGLFYIFVNGKWFVCKCHICWQNGKIIQIAYK